MTFKGYSLFIVIIKYWLYSMLYPYRVILYLVVYTLLPKICFVKFISIILFDGIFNAVVFLILFSDCLLQVCSIQLIFVFLSHILQPCCSHLIVLTVFSALLRISYI